MENKSMGEIISTLRKEKGLTQKQIADQLGITDKAVSKWERDIAFPDTATIPKLAEILGVSVEELLNAKAVPQTGHKGAGFLIIAIALSDPKPTLMCFILGIVCVLPGAMDIARENVGAKTRGKESFDDQWIRLLGNLTAVCGISFYVMLIVMKVLSGFDYRIPDWIAVIWFILMVIALISAVLRDHLIKKQKDPKTVPSPVAAEVQKTSKQEPVAVSKKSENPSPKKNSVQPEPAEAPESTVENLILDGTLHPSGGGVQLHDLTLLVRNNVPSVQWCVTWRGGYSHADAAGDLVPIPDDL